MSKWGWATRIGGYAAAPWTMGASISAANYAAGKIEQKQAANDGPGGDGNDDSDDDNAEAPWLKSLGASSQNLRKQGDEFSAAGSSTLGPLLQRLQAMLGSNPSAMMDATRQERGRVIDQYDTARRAISQFGPRGGGTTSALADSRFAQAESLADITSEATNDATTLAAGLGVQLSGLGLSAQQLASADIDTVIRAILAREGLNVEQRGQNMAMVGDIAETAGTLYGIYMGKDG